MAEPVTLLQATPGRVKVLREMEEHPYSVSDTVDYPESPMQTVMPPTEEAVGGGGGISPFYATIEKDQTTGNPYVHVTGGMVILNGQMQSVTEIELSLPTVIGQIDGDAMFYINVHTTCNDDGEWTTPVIDYGLSQYYLDRLTNETPYLHLKYVIIASVQGEVIAEEIVDGQTVQTIQWTATNNFPSIADSTGLNAISFTQVITPKKACIAKITDTPTNDNNPYVGGQIYPNGLDGDYKSARIFLPESFPSPYGRETFYYTIAHPEAVDAVKVE